MDVLRVECSEPIQRHRTIELVLTLLLGIWSARASFLAGVGCAITFALTVSLVFSTPGALVFGDRIQHWAEQDNF